MAGHMCAADTCQTPTPCAELRRWCTGTLAAVNTWALTRHRGCRMRWSYADDVASSWRPAWVPSTAAAFCASSGAPASRGGEAPRALRAASRKHECSNGSY